MERKLSSTFRFTQETHYFELLPVKSDSTISTTLSPNSVSLAHIEPQSELLNALNSGNTGNQDLLLFSQAHLTDTHFLRSLHPIGLHGWKRSVWPTNPRCVICSQFGELSLPFWQPSRLKSFFRKINKRRYTHHCWRILTTRRAMAESCFGSS